MSRETCAIYLPESVAIYINTMGCKNGSVRFASFFLVSLPNPITNICVRVLAFRKKRARRRRKKASSPSLGSDSDLAIRIEPHSTDIRVRATNDDGWEKSSRIRFPFCTNSPGDTLNMLIILIKPNTFESERTAKNKNAESHNTKFGEEEAARPTGN